MKVRDFLDIIESLAPSGLALDWDNPGLQVGDPMAQVKRAGFALDPSSDTVCQAIKHQCQLLVTHHPLIFKPVKRLSFSDPITLPACLALAGNLSVISAHTNWDAAYVAKSLALAMGLTALEPLAEGERRLSKLVVFVPESHEEKVRQAVFAAGGGSVGDYVHCFYKGLGQGGFKAPLGGKPFVGKPGQEAQVTESRLEIILPPERAQAATAAVRASHPYEEPAFEFYPVTAPSPGFGVVGHWEKPLAGKSLAKLMREKVSPNGLWGGAIKAGQVSRVAVMPGSGGDFVLASKKAEADLYVTGEINHHHSLLAREIGLPVFMAGHFESEYPSLLAMARIVKKESRKLGQAEVIVLKETTTASHLLFGENP
jgi:dinuclear metal center YbgI/SA1388 family protein